MFGGVGALGTGPVAQLVGVVNTSSGGRTKSFVDEMGVFGCPDMADWDSVRDDPRPFFSTKLFKRLSVHHITMVALRPSSKDVSPFITR